MRLPIRKRRVNRRRKQGDNLRASTSNWTLVIHGVCQLLRSDVLFTQVHHILRHSIGAFRRAINEIRHATNRYDVINMAPVTRARNDYESVSDDAAMERSN